MLTIAGVGPGNPKYMTMDVLEKIKSAEYILAFGRVGKSIETIRNDYTVVNKVDEIIDYIVDKENVLLLASGDPNFFGIVEYINKNNIFIKEILPGLSSFQYMMARINKPWQDAKFMSLHGRKSNLKEIQNNKLTIILIDKENNPAYISKELSNLNIKGKMYVGFNLSYEDERIIEIKIGESVENYSSLGVVVVENEMD